MTRLTLLRLAFAIGVIAGAVALLLFVPPPRPILRQLALRTSALLMQDDGGSATRLLRSYIQWSIAARMSAAPVEQGGGDEEILMGMMLRVRQTVLNPRDPVAVRYDARHWSGLVAGIGYCDQINGAVCSVATHHFERVELVGLYDRTRLSMPHTIGRVWSKRRGEWLYFDAFYATPLIFTKDAAGKPHVVKMRPPSPASPREHAPAGVYGLAVWPMTRFPRSFAMYIVSRLRPQATPVIVSGSGDGVGPAGAPDGVLTAAPVLIAESASYPPPRVDARYNDAAYRRVARAYVEARLSHLLGVPDRDAYRAVVDAAADHDDRAAEIAATAQRFATRARL